MKKGETVSINKPFSPSLMWKLELIQNFHSLHWNFGYACTSARFQALPLEVEHILIFVQKWDFHLLIFTKYNCVTWFDFSLSQKGFSGQHLNKCGLVSMFKQNTIVRT